MATAEAKQHNVGARRLRRAAAADLRKLERSVDTGFACWPFFKLDPHFLVELVASQRVEQQGRIRTHGVVFDQRDASALVASQDGHFTIFQWSPCEEMVHAHRVEALLM